MVAVLVLVAGATGLLRGRGATEPTLAPPAGGPGATAVAVEVGGGTTDAPTRVRRDNPDPFVVADGDVYLGYSTQGRSNVPLRTTTDWRTWTRPVDALPELPGWARPGRTWAPAVLERGDGWVLYFSAWHRASGRQCIGAATAATPYGPFEPSASPIVCQLALGGSIDPSPFVDSTGSYLLWKSEDNATGRPARLWAARLTRSGTALRSEPVALLEADHRWEEPLIENPAMLRGDDDRLWLFYSAGPWDTDRYSTGLASCEGPLGPCRKLAHEGPWLETAGSLVGPGGLDTFVTADGEPMASLHAWDRDAVGYAAGGQRSVRIGHLDLTGTLPTLRPHRPEST